MSLFDALDLLCPCQQDALQTVRSNRRNFLKFSAAGAGMALAGPALAGPTLNINRERILSIYAPNTEETLRVIYWTPGEGYIEESIQQISHLLRDRRNGEYKRVDTKLLDTLYSLTLQLEPREPVHLLSGYRSPETNAMLRQRSRRVARNSLHIHAKAVDIRMPDRDFRDLHRAAVALQAGGVGRYGSSQFIHIDTGPVRYWG